jgi:hypothetical protein
MADADEIVEKRAAAKQGSSNPYTYYALLIALYNAMFGGFVVLYRRMRHPLASIGPLDLVMLGLSTLRLSKLISEDEITVVLRRPVVAESGEERHPQGRGLRWALGKLVLCPTCTGTWVAAFLGFALHLFPRYTRPFLAIMSASGMSQIGDAILSLVYTDRDALRKRQD